MFSRASQCVSLNLQAAYGQIEESLPRDKHHETLNAFSDVLLDCIANSCSYLRANGGGRSCLEAELRKKISTTRVEVDTKLAFVMAGTTKQDSDCEDALDRIFRIAHAGPYGARDVVVVEGDEETYSLMVNLKKRHPEKYACLPPMPGVWHFLFHATNGLVLESVCKFWMPMTSTCWLAITIGVTTISSW